MLDLTRSWFGYLALAIFLIAYALVVSEEMSKMAKSKPVLVAAGLIWALIGFAYTQPAWAAAEAAAQHAIFEYGELFLFLMVAITYVNTLGRAPGLRCAAGASSRAQSFLSRPFWVTGCWRFVFRAFSTI